MRRKRKSKQLSLQSQHFKRREVHDIYSSNTVFADVDALALRGFKWRRPTIDPAYVEMLQAILSQAESWLLRVGWKKARS